MATDYDLRLVVDADTDEAQRKLDALAGGGPQPSAVPEPTPEAQSAAVRVREAVASFGGGGGGPSPQVFGTEAGRIAGKIIAAAIASSLPGMVGSAETAGTAARRERQRTDVPSAPVSQPEPAPPPRPQPAPVTQPQPAPPPRPQPAPVTQPEPAPPPRPQPAPVTQPQPAPAPRPRPQPAPVTQPQPAPAPRPNNVQQPEAFGRQAGDVAGRAIGKAVAGFLAHEVARTVFDNIKTPGGDNRTANKAESAVGGALRYGTMGAMLGGPLGAIVGGVVGGGIGYLQEQTRQQKSVEARDQAERVADYSRTRDTAIGASDSAFARSLDMSGGWRQRLDMMRARRDEIASGDGTWSIKNLKEQLKGLDPESGRGKVVAANLETQKNRVASLDQQILQEGLAVAPSRLEPGDVGDSWSKRGIGIGATVDVSQVNEKIMGEVQSCRALLEKIANMGTDNLHSIGAMQRAVFD